MDDHPSHFTGLFYFLAGSVTGASVALLLAPRSGKVTRETIGRNLRNTADSARELKNRVVRRGEEIREEAVHRVDKAASALSGDGRRKVRGKNAGAAPATRGRSRPTV